MTWIGVWTIRLVVVFLGIFCVMLATNLLGLNKSDNPFTSWSGFWQGIALAVGVCGLLAVEALVERYDWPITLPKVRLGENDDHAAKKGDLPLN